MAEKPARRSAQGAFKAALGLRSGQGFGHRGRRIVRYVLGFVTVVLVIDAIVGEKGLLALLKARRDFHAVEAALQRSRRENADLRDAARRLREDPTAIEEIARRELGLIKPGEKLFIIKDAPAKK